MGHLVWGYNHIIVASVGGLGVCHKLAPAAFQPRLLKDVAQQMWSAVLKQCPPPPTSSLAPAKEFDQFISTSSSFPIPAPATAQEENIQEIMLITKLENMVDIHTQKHHFN